MELQTQISNLYLTNTEEDQELISQKRELYMNFAEKVELYDPLDRPLPSEDDVQSITTQELLQRINELTAIDGSLLNAPIPQKQMSFLDNLFKQAFEACEKMADEYVQEAIDVGADFEKDFCAENAVIEY